MSDKTQRYGAPLVGDAGDAGAAQSGLDDTQVANDDELAAARPPSEPPKRAAAASPGPLTGRRLHHFEVLELLGEGGMGAVYRGRDVSLERPVAIKVIAAELAADPGIRERFLREARAQARLNHRAVVPIYYIGEQDGLWFFAMELIDGASLADLTRDAPLDPTEAIELLIEIADALRLAQQRGIIHRDLKPSNLLVDESGRVKIADFGLAKAVDSAQTEGGPSGALTGKGEVLGTPLYMAPEQAQGKATDHRADMYALGATFYQLLSGRPVFTANTPMAIVVQHCTKAPTPLREIAEGVPPALAAVVERLLAKAPQGRYPDYEALIADLVAARPKQATRGGFWVRSIAWAIDVVPLGLFSALLGAWGQLLFALYCVLGWWRYGATFGKWVLRLQVRQRDGDGLPGLGRAAGRFALLFWPLIAATIVDVLYNALQSDAKQVALEQSTTLKDLAPAAPYIIASIVIALAGVAHLVLIIARRGLHDRLTATEVVYRLEEPPEETSRKTRKTQTGNDDLVSRLGSHRASGAGSGRDETPK